MAEGNRILVLFGNVPLLGNERANIETIRQLVERGAVARFLIRRGWTSESIQPELDAHKLGYEFVPYFDTIRKGVGLSTWMRNITAIAKASSALLRQIREVNATHLHCGSLPWQLNFLPALAVSRLPLIFRVGEMPPTHHWIWKLACKFACKRVSRFVCDSEFMKASIVKLGAPEQRCEVIYAPPPRRARVDLAGAPERRTAVPTVVYVGQVSREKGVMLLVEAAAKILEEREVRFLIAGNTHANEVFVKQLRAIIAEKGLEDSINLLGWVEDVRSVYGVADLHVAPSLLPEGYGLTIVEAKDHGLPSIVFPSGGMVELIDDGRDGLVCKEKTADALADAIRLYLDNPGMRAEHGAAGKRSLTERLKVDEYGDRWMAVYDDTRRAAGL